MGPRVRAALWALVVVTGLGLVPQTVQASHIRAGDIQARIDTVNPRRVFFRMVLYTTEGPGVVDEDKVTIFFGDGTSSCYRGVSRVGGRQAIPGVTDTSLNLYVFEHIFPSVGGWTVSYTGENRIIGVQNMSNSSAQSFYISTYVYLDPSLLRNHSPVLTAPAVDKAAIGQVFLHNPGAFDADGDSLAYSLTPSQKVDLPAQDIVGPSCPGATGNNTPKPVTVPNFRYPNDPAISPSTPPVQVVYNGVPVGVPGAPAIFVIDPRTGQITWNAPVLAGVYNVALVVQEWRRTPLSRRLIGEVIRDMQINVLASNNLRPTLAMPADLCVVAGQTVTGIVTATDGVSSISTPQSSVTLYAYSGLIPPATFTQTQTGPPQAVGTFRWQTDCSNVARLPYQVVFKAQDNPNPVTSTNQPLIDEQVWRITVVGPPPQNLRAVAGVSPAGLNQTALTWNRYACGNATQMHIYRKVNPSSFVPGPCDTGIPASAGYTRIASVPAGDVTFTDLNVDDNGTPRGLDRGQTYCYRIYAEFPLPARGASIASQEACITFSGRAARLTNVDVQTTSGVTGQVGVRWTQPRTSSGAPFAGTPNYVLSRGEGVAPATFAPVRTFTVLTDTFYVDTNLNTQDKQYTYKLEFVRTFTDGQAAVTETAPTASSVRTSVVANTPSTTFTVSWSYNVPWDNAARPVAIFRRRGSAGAYAQIATAPTGATGGSYADRDPALVRGDTYSYYVVTEGRYAGVPYLSSLINRSQERSAVLIAPPCTPVLTLERTDCEALAALSTSNGRYSNRLRWTAGSSPVGCETAGAGYRVYYRPGPTGAFVLVATVPDLSYVHGDLAFSGGCYAVQALSAGGVASDTSNVACQDNCVFFSLPNVFTPNGDAVNDVFRPKSSSPVRSVHFQAFNRWGVKVFENMTTAADPVLINWDAGGPAGEAGASAARAGKAADGAYFYLAQVEFADLNQTKRTYKGWVEIIR